MPGLVGGLFAGAGIGMITRAVETSRIAFGPYGLSGNGALAVPQILAPLAIYALWVSLLRAGGAPIAGMVAAVVGLDLGTGLAYSVLARVPLEPASVALGFGVFVLPIAALAGIAMWILRVARASANRPALAVMFVVGIVVSSVPPLSFLGAFGGIGLSIGAAVLAARGARPVVVTLIGAAVLVAGVVSVFAVPLLFIPRR